MKAQNTEVQTLPGILSTEENNNILDFSSTLRELRKNLAPELLRHRDGWRDRNGKVRTIEYVEWHTVADILDETAPNWAHTVKDIRVLGDFVTVTVAITIEGVTREGIGTGSARSEMGIKKAEHDALKRAAVKFGIARELYKREFDAFSRSETMHGSQLKVESETETETVQSLPFDTIARTIADLVTTKQLAMIRAIARERGIDADAECAGLLNCKVNELSRKAASYLIDHLQQKPAAAVPMKKAG